MVGIQTIGDALPDLTTAQPVHTYDILQTQLEKHEDDVSFPYVCAVIHTKDTFILLQVVITIVESEMGNSLDYWQTYFRDANARRTSLPRHSLTDALDGFTPDDTGAHVVDLWRFRTPPSDRHVAI